VADSSAIRLALPLAAWALAIAASASAQPRVVTVPPPRIVALGDSLTSGHGIGSNVAYPAILQQYVTSAGYRYQVINAGVSGDTSTGAAGRLARALDGSVRMLIVAIGANDGLRHVPVAVLKSNLTQIITAAQARRIAVILCGMEAPPTLGREYATAFRNVYRDLAAEYNVPLVPFFLMSVITNPALMQRDRVHPNAEGARRIAAILWPYLETAVRADRDRSAR
jgi:acyl-CoA thioesterase I